MFHWWRIDLGIVADPELVQDSGVPPSLLVDFFPFVCHEHVVPASACLDGPSGDTSSVSFSRSRSQANMVRRIDGTY